MPSQSLRVERIMFGDSRFEDAKRWEFEIFGVENGYTDAADRHAGEMRQYVPWESTSEFFAGFRGADEQPVAILRALRWDPRRGVDSFSTVHDARSFPGADGNTRNMLYPAWDDFFGTTPHHMIAELATQAVRRSERAAGVIEQVWETFAAALTADGVRFVTVALVVPLFGWYRLVLGDAITQIGNVLPDYVGADSVPAVVDLDRIDRSTKVAI